MRRHPAAPLDLVAMEAPCVLRKITVRAPHLGERPGEVHRSGSRLLQYTSRLVQILAPRRRERVPVRSRDPDRGSAAHRERPDRLSDLRRRSAFELDLLVRQPSLIEEDDSAHLEADDPLRL